MSRGRSLLETAAPTAGGPWSWIPAGRPATTVAGAESGIVLLVIGTRLGMLVQGLPSLVSGISISPAPVLYAACWIAAATAAVSVSVASVRRGRGLADRWQALDIAVTVALLLLGPWTVPVGHRIGTWEGFQPGYAVSVAMSIAVMRAGGIWLMGLAAIVAAQVCYVATALDTASLSTTVGNLCTPVVLGFVGRSSVHYLRRVAEDADQARALASEMARREEEQRAQVAIHNGAAVMHLLSDPTLDEATRDRLLEHAPQEATRMRAYLRGGAPAQRAAHAITGARGRPLGPDAVTLAAVVRDKCREFDDLVIESALDLGEGVEVAPDVADAVENALTSLLLNIRVHAGARLVVVHLDADHEQAPTSWVLSVHDDGRGFDAASARLGVGLREVVIAELGRHGVEVDLVSSPTEGTTVTMTGATVPSATASRPASRATT